MVFVLFRRMNREKASPVMRVVLMETHGTPPLLGPPIWTAVGWIFRL